MEQGCPNFLLERDALLSHSIPALRTRDIPRCLDRDTGTMVGESCSNTWDDILSRYLADILAEPKSITTIFYYKHTNIKLE